MKTSSYTLKSEHFSAPVDIDADDSPQTLVTVFAQRCVDATLFDYLKNRYPNSVVIGCSTSGQIINQDIVDEEVVVGVCRFEKTTLKIGSEKVSSSDDSYLAGKKLAQSLNDQELRAIFLLSDGLLVNGSELISGINSEVSNDVSVTGGLAGDADKFESTWVLNNSVADSGAIVGVGFYGDAIKIAHGSQGGWDKFGVERTATKSEHNVLYTIDDRPALELYKEYLGDRAEGLPSTGLLFPLFVKIQNDQELVEKQVVRTILAVSEEDNSLTFAGDIPIGSKIQLMRANFDRLVDGAADAAESLMKMGEMKAGFAIAISCVGRRLVLGERTEEEVEATLETLPSGSIQVGFYSYGEIAPHSSGFCDLHNQTMTLTLFNEI